MSYFGAMIDFDPATERISDAVVRGGLAGYFAPMVAVAAVTYKSCNWALDLDEIAPGEGACLFSALVAVTAVVATSPLTVPFGAPLIAVGTTAGAIVGVQSKLRYRKERRTSPASM